MTQMETLRDLLQKEGIPFEERQHLNTLQIVYPSIKNRVCDAICLPYSYGYEEGLLEIMGLTQWGDDEVEGYLTAKEVFERIKKHYNTNREIIDLFMK